MKGVKHVGRYRAALMRGEVLADVPVRLQRRRAAGLDDRADHAVLAGVRHRHGRGDRDRHRGVVVATPEHLVTLPNEKGGKR